MEKKTESKEEIKRDGNEAAEAGKELQEEKEKESPPAGVIEAKSSQIVPAQQILEGEDYIGVDTTAVHDITILYTKEVEKDPNVEMVKAWFEHLTDRNIDIAHEIDVGIEIAKEVTADYHEFYDLTQMTVAGKYILIGEVLLRLKKLTRSAGFMWTKWASTHLRYLKPRSRERAMLLAERVDCHPYLPLGVERLELLVQATRGSKNKDPIGSLLRKYNILYQQDSDVSPAEFKALIDAVLNAERFSQNGISVDFELVKRLTNSKVEVDSGLVKRLQETRESGGSEQRYLEHLALGGRKTVLDSDPDRPVNDFNSSCGRLLKALAEIPEDETHLEKIDADALSELITELQSLQKKLTPTMESQAE
jgi:hypothetical protein